MSGDVISDCLTLLKLSKFKGINYVQLEEQTQTQFFNKKPMVATQLRQTIQKTTPNTSVAATAQPHSTIRPHVVPANIIPELRPETLASVSTHDELQNHYMQLCHTHGLKSIPFIEGNPNSPQLLFISESPLVYDAQTSKIFNGPAGELLDKMIAAMKPPAPQDVAHIAIVKTTLPNNRGPSENELAMWAPLLEQQIHLINPKIIVLLGNKPLQTLTGKEGIGTLRGQWQSYHNIPAMPTYHPLYVVRITGTAREKRIKSEIWSDLKQVMARLGWQR